MPNSETRATTINLDGKDYLISLDLTDPVVRQDLVNILKVMEDSESQNEGLLSKEDKIKLDKLYDKFPIDDDTDTFINKLEEVLAFFSGTTEDKTLIDLIAGLSAEQIGADGKYIKYVSQKNGQLRATAVDFDTSITANGDDKNAPTTKAVRDAIKALDVNEFKLTSTDDNIITLRGIKETDGKIEVGTADVTFYNKEGTATQIANAIDNLDITDISNTAGKTVKKITESNGKVGATFQDISITSAQISDKIGSAYDPDGENKDKVATSETIYKAIYNLNAESVGENGKYIKIISETAGEISATAQAFDTTINSNSNNNNAPTSKAVKNYVDTYGGKIDSISLDGTALTIDANKNVDLPTYPTKSSLGLGNVNNTSDLNKPISTATQTALDAKADDSAVVHKGTSSSSSAEDIYGSKTFKNGIITGDLTIRDPNDDVGYKLGINTDWGDSYPYFAIYKNGSYIGSIDLPTVTDEDSNKVIATIDDITNTQMSAVVVTDAVTNINGRAFQNYTANLVTSDNYIYYQILRQGSNPTEEEAKEYMRYMTGSTFVPKYNYDFPKQTIFFFADRSMWKPQYSSSDGLRLYKLSPELATLDDIQTISGADRFVQVGSADSSIAQTIYGAKTFKGSDLTFINGPYSNTDWTTVKIINDFSNPKLQLIQGNGNGNTVEYATNQIKRTIAGGSTYTINLPAKSGTLATTDSLGTYSVSAGSSTTLSSIDGGGLYHMYVLVKSTEGGGYTNINNYADVGTIRLRVHSYSLNTDLDKYQFLGSTKCAYGTGVDTYYFYAMWSSAEAFTIHGRTSIADAKPGNTNTFGGEIWLIKICN